MFLRLKYLPIKSVLTNSRNKLTFSAPKNRLLRERNVKFKDLNATNSEVSSASNIFKVVGIGSSALGIGFICYHGLRPSSGSLTILEERNLWPQYIRDRIRSTYTYFGASVGLTAAAAWSTLQNPSIQRYLARNSMMSIVVSLVAVIGTATITRLIPYSTDAFGMKHMMWLVHCGTMGVFISPVCMMGGQIMKTAAFYTMGLAGGLSAVACTAPNDKFLYMGGGLGMGLGLLIVSSLAGLFLNPVSKLAAGNMALQMYGGLALFSGFLLYDTQNVVQRAKQDPDSLKQFGQEVREFDPINNALNIYMDTLNIFIRIATMLGSQKKK